MFHAQQGAEDVGIEGGRIAFGGLLRYETAPPLSRGVVDGNIEATKARDGLIDQVAHIVIGRTSARQYSASTPSSRSSATNFWPTSSRRPETAIRAPSRAKAIAVARPMPVKAPVIKTTGVFMTYSFNLLPNARTMSSCSSDCS